VLDEDTPHGGSVAELPAKPDGSENGASCAEHWSFIKAHIGEVMAAVDAVEPGSYTEVEIPRGLTPAEFGPAEVRKGPCPNLHRRYRPQYRPLGIVHRFHRPGKRSWIYKGSRRRVGRRRPKLAR